MGLEPKKDCFGYKNSSYCGALTEMVCTKRKCTFHKTKEQFIKDREKYGSGETYSEVYKRKHREG